jgi:ABC-type multidrug transport system permease subunit
MHVVTALLATILAAALLQVALLAIILVLLLTRTSPSESSIWIALALPGVLALGSLVGAGLAWGSVRRSLRKPAPVSPGSESTPPEGSSGPVLVSLKQERAQQ